jgi:hypothetical protein
MQTDGSIKVALFGAIFVDGAIRRNRWEDSVIVFQPWESDRFPTLCIKMRLDLAAIRPNAVAHRPVPSLLGADVRLQFIEESS